MLKMDLAFFSNLAFLLFSTFNVWAEKPCSSKHIQTSLEKQQSLSAVCERLRKYKGEKETQKTQRSATE